MHRSALWGLMGTCMLLNTNTNHTVTTTTPSSDRTDPDVWMSGGQREEAGSVLRWNHMAYTAHWTCSQSRNRHTVSANGHLLPVTHTGFY